MDNLDKYIDGLFHDKLSEAVKPESFSEIEWMRLRKTIRSKNFFRFNAGSFNVYYLSFVISAVVAIGVIINNNFIKNIETVNHENIPIANSDSIDYLIQENLQHDSFLDENTLEIKAAAILHDTLQKDKKYNQKDIASTDSSRKETQKIDLHPIIKIDTSRISLPSTEEDKQLLLPSLADTIFVIDTIKVTKKQIKFQRKIN